MKFLYRKSKFKIETILLGVLLMLFGQLNAQHGWSINVASYANSGNITGIVYLDGNEVSSGALGAFVGEECRGFTDIPTFFPPSGHTIFTFLVYSNLSSGDMLSFKYYNDLDGEIYDVTEEVEFISDMIVGSALVPLNFNAISNEDPVVDFPLADLSLDEHFSSTTINLDAVFSDPDLDLLTYSASSSNGGVVSVSVSGSDLIINEHGLGTSTITVTASDGLASIDDAFNVSVNNVNDPPQVATLLPDISPNEGFTSTTVNLSGAFMDPDGNALTYSALSSNNEVVTVSVSGAILTIHEVGLGSSTITVTASDGTLSAEDQFNVLVNNVNDAPVVASAVPDQVLDEHFSSTTINLTGVFSDPDGDDLTLTPVSSNPSVVSVGINGLILTLTEGGVGSSTITVTASDGPLSVNDAFLVTVNNVNDAPVVSNPVVDQNLNEHFGSTSVELATVFTDPDGDELTLSAISSAPAIATVSLSGTTLTINEVGIGSTTITLTASDGSLFNTDQFAVNIANVNDPPVVASAIPDQNLEEHFTTHSIDLTGVFFDPDGTDLILTPVSNTPSVVTVGLSGMILTLTEVGLGTSTITVTASDGSQNTFDSFLVTVTNVNDAPVVLTSIPDQSLSEHFTSTTINLSGVFDDPDDDALTLTAVSALPSVVDVSVAGTVLTIVEAGLGTSLITVTASDGSLSTIEEFNVTVNNINDAPVVSSPYDDQVLDEHFTTTTMDLTGVFSDPDGNSLALSVLSSNTGVVTASVAGNLLTVNERGLGTSFITVTASDGTLTVSDQFRIEVVNVNDAPEVVSAISDRSYDEGFGSANIALSSVFSDPDGDVMTYTAVSSDATILSVTVTGSILTINELSLGSVTITVTASDGSLSTTDEFVVTNNNVNDAPVVDNPVLDQAFNEHFISTAIDVSNVFSDPDNDPLTITALSSDISVVGVSVTGTTLTFTEAGLGTTTITLTASDGALSASDAFTITVNNVNDAPFVVSELADRALNEHFSSTSISLVGVFSDPDNDALILTAESSDQAVASVSVAGTLLTINEGIPGSSTITVRATDGALFVEDAFILTVNNVNDPPVIVSGVSDRVLNEHFTSRTINISAVFDDPDGDDLTITPSSSHPSVVTVSLSGSILTINEVGIGTSTISLTASDGALSVVAEFTVTVNNVNDAPIVENPITDRNINEHFGSTTLDLTDVFSDPDGDGLTLTPSTSDPSVVTVGINGMILRITEVGLGSATITVSASDGTLTINDAFLFTVNNVNDAPVVIKPVADQNYNEHFGSSTIDLSGVFSDPDGNALTYTVSSGTPSVVSVTLTGSVLRITEQGIGSSLISLAASDGTLFVNTDFTVTVTGINDAPVVSNALPDRQLDEHFSTLSINLSSVFVDPDGDDLSLSVGSSNVGIVTAVISGTMLTLTEVGLGNSLITVTASDGTLSVNDQFSVTVNNVNDAPLVISPITNRSYDEGFGSATISLAPVFSDPDGNVLTMSASSGTPGVVTVLVTGTTLTITEVSLGTSLITVVADDGGLTSSTTFTVSVDNVNDAPIVISPVTDQVENEHFGSATIDLSGVFSDPDGDVLTLIPSSSDPNVATAGINGTTLTIYEEGLGITTITVNASDGSLSVNDAFTVTINNVNDAPVVANPISNQSENEHFSSTSMNLASVFSDPDNDALTLSATSSNNSIVTVSIAGTLLTLTEVGIGSATITVSASDGTLSTNEDFLFTISNVNDRPVVVAGILDQSRPEHFISTTIDLTDVFSDPDGDELSYNPVSANPLVVTASINGTILTLNEVGLGSSLITITASDGLLSVNDVFEFTVTNVNDAPIISAPVADRVLNEHFGSTTINISSVFTDPDDDAIALSALSSNTSIIDVSVSGATLTIIEAGLGTANVTLTGSDGFLDETYTFSVTVNDINDAPYVAASINDRVLDEHFGSINIDLSGVFDDPEDDLLFLSAVSSNISVATVNVVGTTLSINEVGIGFTTITITASDASLSAEDQFLLTIANVNDPPEVVVGVADQSYTEHFTTHIIDISGVFSDPDGDALILSASSSNPGIVTASVSGTNLVISERGLGVVSVSITASDGTLSITDQFLVSISNVNDPPEVLSPISSVSYNEGFGSANISLTGVFSDPDGNSMSYTAISSNTSVVSVLVSGSTLTVLEGSSLGSSTITVTASDGSLSTDDQFTITVNNVNDAPEVVIPVGDRFFDEGFGTTSLNLSAVFSDPDGNALTLSVANSDPSVVTVSISGTTLLINEVGLGTTSITLTASDASLSVDNIFDITVNNVNDAPIIENNIQNQYLNEYFSNIILDLTDVFSDPDGDELTLSAISSNNGVVGVSVSGTDLTLNEFGLGLSTITVTASDGILFVSDQFTVSVSNVNDAPVLNAPIADRFFDEGFTSTSISLAPIFSDPDGDVLNLSAVSSDHSVATVAMTGTILNIYEVGLGSTNITVTARDASLSVSDEFLITINNVNEPPEVENPVADQDLLEHFGVTSIDVSMVFSDPDGDELTLTPISSEPSVVTVVMSGTDLIITEAGLGESNITITANDGMLTMVDAFSVTVHNVNDAPVATSPPADQVYDEYFGSSTIDVSSVFTDPDGDLMTLSASSSDHAVIDATVSGTDLIISEVGLGVATITLTASDGSLSGNDQIQVTVNNVNDAPVVAIPVSDRELDEHFSTSTIDLSGVFSDKDGDVLAFSASSADNSVLTVSVSGAILTLIEEGLGTTDVTVTASDGALSANNVFQVRINNVNDRPTVQNPPADLELNEHFTNHQIELGAVFGDPDNDILTITSLSSDESVVTVSISGTELTFIEEGLGSSTITLIASDGELSIETTFMLTVNNVNDAPLISNPLSDLDLDEHFSSATVSLANVFDDPDGDDLTLTAVSSANSVVTVNVSGTSLLIGEAGLGTSTITITASDGNLSVDEQFDITVNNVNDRPEVASPLNDRSLNEHFGSTTIDLSGVFSDPDGDALTITAISGNTGVVTVAVDGSTLTIIEEGLGSATLTLTASDAALSVSHQFGISVDNVNDRPVVSNPIADMDLYEYFNRSTYDLSAIFTDPDGDAITLSASSSNTDVVTVSLLGSTLTINEVGLGSSTISITASDGSLNVTDKFIVIVHNVNDPPVLDNPLVDQVLNEHFGTFDISVSGVFSDPDGDALILSAISSNKDAVTVSINGSILSITEVGLGTSTITVSANDGTLGINDAFLVTVNNVNDAPRVDNPMNDISLGEKFGTRSIDLTNVFTDPDGDALTISATSSNTGVVTVSVSGYSLLLTEVAKGTTTITLTASDGSLSVSDQFVLTVDDVNFAPTVVNGLLDLELLEHFDSVKIELSSVFSDPDGDPLLYIAVSSNEEVLTVDTDKTILTIREVGLGTATITVQAGDGEFTVEELFDVRVANVNDVPVITDTIADFELIENFGTIEFDLRDIFSDPDGDTLTFEALSLDETLVNFTLNDTIIAFYGVGVGVSEVVITAKDTSLSVSDTITVSVVAEVDLIVVYNEEIMIEQDTIVRCNDAGEFNIDIESGTGWYYTAMPGWITFDKINDSTLYVAFSENLTGNDRWGLFTIHDAQGHVLNLYLRQTANCKPDNVWSGELFRNISLYPNPVEEVLYISVGDLVSQEFRLEIIDINGKLLYQQDIPGIYSETIQLDMSAYRQGVYFIRLSDDGAYFIDTVIKQ